MPELIDDELHRKIAERCAYFITWLSFTRVIETRIKHKHSKGKNFTFRLITA